MASWGRRLWFGDGILPHQRIHEGKMFHAHVFKGAVANNGSLQIMITTVDQKLTNLIPFASASGHAEMVIYEGVAFSGGSPLDAHNLKRNSPSTYGGSLVHTPNILSLGSTLLQAVVPGGEGGNAVGSSPDLYIEWLLAPRTAYLYELINRRGNAADLSLSLLFYTTHPETYD